MTRAGIGALALGAVFVALGAVLVWPALVVLGSGALVAVVIALWWVARPPSLRIERQIYPDRVPKGAPAVVYLDVANTSRSKLPATVALQPYGDRAVRAVLPELRGGERGVRTYRLPTSRRGVFELGPLEVARSDPFELLRVVRRFGDPFELWVCPRILPLVPLPSGATRSVEGPSSDTAPEGDITFHRLREYVSGDDLRMIHWKSTARTGRLMVRHNIDTSQPYTVVLLDLDPAVYSADTFETAVDVAASVATASARGNAAVQLCLGSGDRVGGAGERTVRPLIDRLTTVEPDPASDIGRELARLRRHRGGTAVVVVTGVARPDIAPAVAALRPRFRRVVLVPVGDATERSLRPPGVRVLAAPDGDQFAAAWNLEAGHRPGAIRAS